MMMKKNSLSSKKSHQKYQNQRERNNSKVIMSMKNSRTKLKSAERQRSGMKSASKSMSMSKKMLSQYENHNNIYSKNGNQEQQNYDNTNIRPKRLFQQLQKQHLRSPGFVPYSSGQKGQSNYNQTQPVNSTYKQKYFDANQKYLQEKNNFLQCKQNLLQLKSSIQNFFMRPQDKTVDHLMEKLMRLDNLNNTGSFSYTNNKMPQAPQFSQILPNYKQRPLSRQQKFNSSNQYNSNISTNQTLIQNAKYILTCYQDIQLFKQQLQQLLSLTHTSSLQQLKQYLHHKFILQQKYGKSSSVNQVTYRILELQSNNNRLKQQYEKMINDVKQKADLQIYNERKERKLQNQKFANLIKKLEDQIFMNNNRYHGVMSDLDRLVKFYYEEVEDMLKGNYQNRENYQVAGDHNKEKQVNNNKEQYALNIGHQKKLSFGQSRSNQDRKFIQKMKKLSQFTIQYKQFDQIQSHRNQQSSNNQTPNLNDISQQSSQYHLYDSPPQKKHLPQPHNQLSIKKYPPSHPSIQHRLPSQTTPSSQISAISQLLLNLITQIYQIQTQAEQNRQKVRQYNEAILGLDQKMELIKQEMQEQIREEEVKRSQKDQEIGKYMNQIQQKKLQILELEQGIQNRNSQIEQKDKELKLKQLEIEGLKVQVFKTNERYLKEFKENMEIKQFNQSQIIKLNQIFDHFIIKLQKSQKQALQTNPLNSIEKQISSLWSNTGNKTQHQQNLQHPSSSLSTLNTQLISLLTANFQKIHLLFISSQNQSQKTYHQMIKRQKQSFQLQQNIKIYQQKIIFLQTSLNNMTLEKEEYEYLLAQTRKQFSEYKQHSINKINMIQRQKTQQLLGANRTILQANAKLNTQVIQLKQQTLRLNRQLQQKLNQRTFLKRKMGQNDYIMQQKDKKILQLQKQLNKYKIYLKQIQQSFQTLVKNQQITSMKIITLQKQKLSIKENIQQLKSVNGSLEKQNNQFRQQNNILRTQINKLKQKVKQLTETKQNYEQINVQIRMKKIQVEENLDKCLERLKMVQNQYEKQKAFVMKLQKNNNTNMEKENKFIQEISQLKDEKGKLSRNNSKLGQKVKILEQINLQMQLKNKELNNQITKLKSTNIKYKQEIIHKNESIEKQIISSKQKIEEDFNHERQEFQEEKNRLNGQIIRLKNVIKQLQTKKQILFKMVQNGYKYTKQPQNQLEPTQQSQQLIDNQPPSPSTTIILQHKLDQVDKMKQQILFKIHQVDKMKQQLDRSREQFDRSKSRYAQQRQNLIKQKQSELQLRQQKVLERENQINQLNESISIKYKQLQKNQVQLTKKQKQLQTKLQVIEKQILKLNLQKQILNKQRLQLQNLKQTLDHQQTHIHQQSKSLQIQLLELNQLNAQGQQKMQLLQLKQQQLTKQQNKLSSQQLQLTQLQQRLFGQQQEIQTRLQQIRLKEEFSNQREQKLLKIEEQLRNRVQEFDKKQNQKKVRENDYQNVKNVLIKELQERIRQKQQEILSIVQQNKQINAKNQVQINLLKRQVQQKSILIQQKNQQISRKESQIKNLQQQIKQLQTTTIQHQKTIIQLKNHLQSISSSSQIQQNLNNNNHNHSQQLHNYQTKITQLQQTIQSLQQTLLQQQLSLKQRQQKLQQKQIQLKKHQQQCRIKQQSSYAIFGQLTKNHQLQFKKEEEIKKVEVELRRKYEQMEKELREECRVREEELKSKEQVNIGQKEKEIQLRQADVQRRQVQVGKRQIQVGKRQTKITNKQKQTQLKQKQLQVKQKQLNNKQKKLNNRQDLLNNKSQDLTNKEQDLQTKLKQLTKKQQQTRIKQKQLIKKQLEIQKIIIRNQQKQQQLLSRQQSIVQKQQLIQTKTKQLNQKEQSLQSTKTQLQQLNKKLQAQSLQQQQKQQQLFEKQQQIRYVEQEHQDQQKQLQARKAQINNTYKLLTQQEERIKEREINLVNQQKQRMELLNQKQIQLQEMVLKQNLQLIEREQKIEKLREQLNQREQEIKKREQQVELKEYQLNTKQIELNRYNNDGGQKQQKQQGLEQYEKQSSININDDSLLFNEDGVQNNQNQNQVSLEQIGNVKIKFQDDNQNINIKKTTKLRKLPNGNTKKPNQKSQNKPNSKKKNGQQKNILKSSSKHPKKYKKSHTQKDKSIQENQQKSIQQKQLQQVTNEIDKDNSQLYQPERSKENLSKSQSLPNNNNFMDQDDVQVEREEELKRYLNNQDGQELSREEAEDKEQEVEQQEQDQNPNDIAQLYSTKKLLSLPSANQIKNKQEKSSHQWIQQINLILGSLVGLLPWGMVDCDGINGSSNNNNLQSKLTYFDQIQQKYTRLKAKVLRNTTYQTVGSLQLDLSLIDSKNSISSPSNASGSSKPMIIHRQINTQNQDKQNTRQKQPHQIMKRSAMNQRERQKQKQASHSQEQSQFSTNFRGTGKQFVQSLKEVNSLLQKKLQQVEFNNHTLILQNQQLKDKLYILQNQTSIKALQNIFVQLIKSYEDNNIDKFEETCRIFMKMQHYSDKKIEEFMKICQQRRKKTKGSSFFQFLKGQFSPTKKK